MVYCAHNARGGVSRQRHRKGKREAQRERRGGVEPVLSDDGDRERDQQDQRVLLDPLEIAAR